MRGRYHRVTLRVYSARRVSRSYPFYFDDGHTGKWENHCKSIILSDLQASCRAVLSQVGLFQKGSSLSLPPSADISPRPFYLEGRTGVTKRL